MKAAIKCVLFVGLMSQLLVVSGRADAGASTQTNTVSSLPPADSNTAVPAPGPAPMPAGSASEERELARLLAWWKFDEADGTTAADSSGRGCTGTLFGNPQWQTTAGKIKGALAFDGAGDAVGIQNAPALDVTGAITVAAWIKVDRFDKRWQTIIAKGDTAWRLQRTAEEDTLAFHCTGLHSVKGRWPLGIEGRTSVNDGQWHHVAGIYDGAVISLYLDGALDNSSRASGTIQLNSIPVFIGANAEASDRNWQGLIDEVCVFACALNADGVSALYAGQEPAVIVERASALVSPEEVETTLRAGRATDATAPELDSSAGQQDQEKSRRWPLALMILAVAALAVGGYVVQRKGGAS